MTNRCEHIPERPRRSLEIQRNFLEIEIKLQWLLDSDNAWIYFMNLPIVENLVTASHILADQGVLDGLGHISARHPDNPQGYLMPRSLAPALVTLQTSSNTTSIQTLSIDRTDRFSSNVLFMEKPTRFGRTFSQ